MIEIVRFHDGMQDAWDRFIDRATNTHFFFKRRYFLHQKHRFQDHSLLVYYKNKIAALLPAVELVENQNKKIWSSHAGLSFGGIVLNSNFKLSQVAELFDNLKSYLLSNNFTHVHYKAMPSIYYKFPSHEDIYVLFTQGAELYSVQPYSVIAPDTYPKNSTHRRRSLDSSMQIIDIDPENRLLEFHRCLSENLQDRYGVDPVHGYDELKELQERFPENIVAKGICADGELVAGVLLFINKTVVHCQYLFNTPFGRKIDGLTILLSRLMYQYNRDRYFSLGISTERNGKFLNSGLIRFKEKFGARSITQNTYEWILQGEST